MSRNRQRRGSSEEKISKQQAPQPEVEDMTPGRAPAEGADVNMYTTPLHEWWEQHVCDRDPAEGADLIDTSEKSVKR